MCLCIGVSVHVCVCVCVQLGVGGGERVEERGKQGVVRLCVSVHVCSWEWGWRERG